MTQDPLNNYKIVKAREFAGNYVLLCYVPESITPWVTWISPTIDGKAVRHSGHYYFDSESAKLDFESRW